MPVIRVPRKLLPLIQVKKRFKIVIGGRGGGKSQSIADICLKDAQTDGLKIGCFREFQNSIEDSVHSLLSDEIERLDLQGFTIQTNVISCGDGEFKFKGLARNPSSVKSMHGFKRFWVEEAQTISNKSLKILTPTLRTEGSEIWMSANPMSRADPFSQRFIVPFQDELDRNGYYEDDLHLIIVCNYMDNPFFPDVLEQERQHDYETLPRAEYDHIWLGKHNDGVENSIIKSEWFDACIDAHKKSNAFKPRGVRVVAYDPFDDGNDAAAVAGRHGSIIEFVKTKDSGQIDVCTDWAAEEAKLYHADWFFWDGDGMGTGLKRQVALAFNGVRIQYEMFRGSLKGSAMDDADRYYEPGYGDYRDSKTKDKYKDIFFNNRARYYMDLAARCHNTYRHIEKGEYIDPDDMISFSSDGIKDMDNLRSQLCRIPKKEGNINGLIQLMSKKEMFDKYKIPSPNEADAVMMTMKIPKLLVNAGPSSFDPDDY